MKTRSRHAPSFPRHAPSFLKARDPLGESYYIYDELTRGWGMLMTVVGIVVFVASFAVMLTLQTAAACWPLDTPWPHSHRSACTGSMRVARRAGR